MFINVCSASEEMPNEFNVLLKQNMKIKNNILNLHLVQNMQTFLKHFTFKKGYKKKSEILKGKKSKALCHSKKIYFKKLECSIKNG